MKIFGLDFGTTNTSISVESPALDSSGESATVAISTVSFPSVIFYPKARRRKPLVGDEAIHDYRIRKEPGRFFQSIKSVIADPSLKGTNIFGVEVSICELIALIMRKAKEDLERETGVKSNRVVLGRPVRFVHSEDDEVACERLEEAAKLAGFESVSFEFEPIAAGLHYERNLKREETVLIGDFGGGTSDFSIVKLGGGRKRNERGKDVLSVSGCDVGGNNFDAAILSDKVLPSLGRNSEWGYANQPRLGLPNYIFNDLCDWEKFPFLKSRNLISFLSDVSKTTNDPEGVAALLKVIRDDLGYELYRNCECAKREANDSGKSLLSIAIGARSIRESLELHELDLMLTSEIKRITNTLSQCLENAVISENDVDRVFLTGGSSLLNPLRNGLMQLFEGSKVVRGDAFSSVSSGLASRH